MYFSRDELWYFIRWVGRFWFPACGLGKMGGLKVRGA